MLVPCIIILGLDLAIDAAGAPVWHTIKQTLPDPDLTVRVSYDEGRTWPIQRLLWPGPAAYCCLGVLPDGQVACLLEGGKESPYERIVLARFGRQWLTNAQDEP